MALAAILLGLASALVATADVAPAAASLYPDRTPGPFASVADAYGFLLGEVCLPYVVSGQPIDGIAKARRLTPMLPASAGASTRDKVWRVGPITTGVYAVAWADGSCTVFTEGGETGPLVAMGDGVIRRRIEGFTPGLRETLPDGERNRVTYCEAARPHPYVITVTSAARQSHGVKPVSSTVFRSKMDEPGFCNPVTP